MTRKPKTVQEKTEEMVEAGSIKTSDFSELDAWDQSNPVNRPLTEDEQEQLREIGRQQVREHRKNKL